MLFSSGRKTKRFFEHCWYFGPSFVKMDSVKKTISRIAGGLKLDAEIVGKDVKRLETLLELFAEDESFEIHEFPLSETLLEKPISCSSMGVYFQYFVKHVGLLLDKLSKELEKECDPQQSGILNTEETRSVSVLVQFYMKFGILHHLENGVGGKDCSRLFSSFGSFSLREIFLMLADNSCTVFAICETCIILREIVLKTSLNTVLATFMQLSFSPTSARLFDKPRRQEFMSILNKIICSWIAKDRFVEEILILQGDLSKNIVPKWLRDKCGTSLTRTLLGKNGIRTVITSMVMNLTGNEAGSSNSWEKVITLSTIMSTIPSTGITVEEYCKLACPQLLDLLISARKNVSETSEDIVRIVVTTLHALNEKYPDESYVIEKIICDPLSKCCYDEKSESQPRMDEVTKETLSDCIENLHQICVAVGVVPDSLLSLLITPYFRILFLLLCDTQETSSHFKNLSSQLLVALLKGVGGKKAANLILSLFCKEESIKLSIKIPFEDFKFSFTEECEIAPIIENVTDPSEVLLQQDKKVKVITEIILHSDLDGLSGEVLLLLLKNLCNPEKNLPSQLSSTNSILTSEDKAILALKSNEERFITFGLLTSLCETVEPNILLSNTSQILAFIKAMLEDLIFNSSDSQERLKICIGVLGICLMTEVDSSQRDELNSIATILETTSSTEGLDKETRDLLSDVTIAIRTHGAVNEASFCNFSKAMKEELGKFDKQTNQSPNEEAENASTKVKEIDAKSNTAKTSHRLKESDFPISKTLENDKNSESGAKAVTSFNEALEEVFDPSPAIKGGSVRYLTKCIQQKVPEAIRKLDKLVAIFLECLDHKDSFVYLSAVRGLAIIVNSATNHNVAQGLFNKIVAKFLSCANEDSESNLDIESRMKFGEILTRVIRGMGELAPHHAAVFLPEFLKGARHPDPDVRASCLSNFAELAPMAPYFLSQIQHDIRQCLCNISRSDSNIMVRRSAVYAIYQLVTKLGEDVLNVFGDVIKDFYRTLKSLYQQDDDNSVQLHAQLALEELDRVMRASIFKPPTLSKTINITQVPFL